MERMYIRRMYDRAQQEALRVSGARLPSSLLDIIC